MGIVEKFILRLLGFEFFYFFNILVLFFCLFGGYIRFCYIIMRLLEMSYNINGLIDCYNVMMLSWKYKVEFWFWVL